ncbi:MAG: hypothetical protein LBE31_11790 [Deltaproteobacteria bacterium]|nr:hypothetical protein [Deltaproteobacteria bacterium]
MIARLNPDIAKASEELKALTLKNFEMIARLNPDIAEIWKELIVLSLDTEARALSELIDKNEIDLQSEYFGAYEKGIEKGVVKGVEKGIETGVVKGRKETALETATAAIKKNLPLEDIAEITPLSLDEVKQLAASLKD